MAYCREIRLLLYYRKFNRNMLIYVGNATVLWFVLGILTFLQDESNGLRQHIVFCYSFVIFARQVI